MSSSLRSARYEFSSTAASSHTNMLALAPKPKCDSFVDPVAWKFHAAVVRVGHTGDAKRPVQVVC